VYLKRDDELSFGVSGSKYRKFAALVPFLQRNQFHEVVLIGGAHSNNVASLAQLLLERGIEPFAFLRGEAELPSQGNHLLNRMLLGPQRLRYVPRSEWDQVQDTAHQYAEARRAAGYRTFVINEGSASVPALPGTCSLMTDMLRNETQLGLSFSDVFIDAGTGMTAAALLLMDAAMATQKRIHVILTACTAEAFQQQLTAWHYHFEQLIQQTVPRPEPASLQSSRLAPAYGKVDSATLDAVVHLAQTYGVLADPVYAAKLLVTARALINEQQIGGTPLLIHSGGGTGLWGYQTELARRLPQPRQNPHAS
jgi:1-aminocyclopropane-1-carboxylate deaminase/D-cysteine desulfhydrase-like pyridoxal-dependent ACC family enzyme